MFDLYFTFPLAEKSLYEQFDFAHTAVFLLFGNIANIFVCLFFPGYLREVAKKVIFLVAMATKALRLPPPLLIYLSVHLYLIIIYVSLS